MDAAWARVRREISHVARRAGQIERRSLGRAGALLRYHAKQSLNPAYRALLDDAGVDPAAAGAWHRVPVIDKGWLARAGYDRQPACPGPVLIVGTSGSTATQVLVPVTARCANRGLGDNFLRALAMSGVGPGHRHWGIEHRPDAQGQGITGSSISMTWLARHGGANALVTAATAALDEQLRRAVAFEPDTISGSPGFLQRIARAAVALHPVLLVYGGAALAGTDAAGLGMRFEISSDGGARLAVADAEADPGLAALFPALISRVTDKRPYPPEAVEPPRLTWPEGTAVYYAADREYLADLHREAVGELARTDSFGRELAGWLRTDPADPRRDGMTMPLPPDAADALIAALGRSGETLKEMGERDAQALAAGPLAGLLSTAEDTRAAWVRAGLAWQRLALAAHADGLAVAPLTAVVENPRTRRAASALVPAGQHVQVLFRLGRSAGPLPPTPRRDPALILVPGRA